MQVIRGLESVSFSGIVLTVGNFDGVHCGHQAIIAAGRQRADSAGTQLVAMTFDPHPATIIAPDRMPAALTCLEEKIRLLERVGVDVIVVVQSRPEFFHITADQFISDIIMARFKPRFIVEGASFRFGQHRRGDGNTLRAVADRYGFEVEIIEPIRANLGGHPDTVISSSLIRHLISSGTVDQAALCLGRPYTLVGSVVPGVGRGQKLGFPTANIGVESQMIPAEGIYAGRAKVKNQEFTAAISIGRYPTFDGGDLLVEAHLLDFDGAIYDQAIRLEFYEWLRPQEKFDSPQELSRQIARDVEQTRKIVSNHRIVEQP
ncbi:MAG: bifunctional riboflavin kinase/FAD synthetase [Planctomycetota bacterium]|nr:MAG: bifunctional riboflavin kinase/FAD synthetase [Planctomycetota bacterium]